MSVNITEVLIIVAAIVGAFSLPLLLALAARGKRKPLKPKPEDLIEAEQLVAQGNYALSIIKAFIAVEVCLKFRLNEKEKSFEELVKTARSKRLLSRESRNKAEELFKLRQELIHDGGVKPSEQEAKGYLRTSAQVIAELGFATD